MKFVVTLAAIAALSTVATATLTQPTTAEANASPAYTTNIRPKIDADRDGRISRAAAANRPRMAQHFDKIDANKDGFLDRNEMKAAKAMRQAQKIQ